MFKPTFHKSKINNFNHNNVSIHKVIKEKDNEIASFRVRIATMESQIKGLSASVKELSGKVEELTNEVKITDKHYFKSVNQTLTALDDKDKLQVQIDDLKMRIR